MHFFIKKVDVLFSFTGKMDRFMFVDSLKSLVRSVDKPVIIITDGYPVHRENIH